MKPIELFHANTGLACSIAVHYKRKNDRVTLEDLVQEALLALWLAATRYDAKSGKFSAYAGTYCSGYCKNYVSEKSDLIRKPTHEYWRLPAQRTTDIPIHLASTQPSALEILIEAEDEQAELENYGEQVIPEPAMKPKKSKPPKPRRKREYRKPNRLTSEQVLGIFALKGLEGGSAVAKRFGVTASTVSHIWTGRQWSKLTRCYSESASSCNSWLKVDGT